MIHDGLAQFVSAPGKFLKEKIEKKKKSLKRPECDSVGLYVHE